MKRIDFELESDFMSAQFNPENYLYNELKKFTGLEYDRLQFVLNGRVPSKKNSRVTVRKTGRSFPSKDYSDWHKNAEMQILVTRVPRKELENLLAVAIIIYFPDNRISDLTNKAESIMDLMVDCKIIKNDNWKNTGTILLIPRISQNSPGALIDIFIRRADQCLKDFIHA